LERGPLTLKRAERLGSGLELLLPLADHATLLHQLPASRLLLDGATGALGLDLAVFRLRRGTVGPGRVAFSGSELGPELHLGPLLMRLDPAGGGMAPPLGGEGEVAVQLLDLDPYEPEPPGDLGPLHLRRGAGPRDHVPPQLRSGHRVPLPREQPAQLLEALLQPRGALREQIEVTAGEGELDRELLLGQLRVPLGLTLLAG